MAEATQLKAEEWGGPGRFVRFEGSKDGKSVWVNPDQVMIVEAHSSEEGVVVIYLSGFHTFVKGEPADVVRQLRKVKADA